MAAEPIPMPEENTETKTPAEVIPPRQAEGKNNDKVNPDGQNTIKIGNGNG